MRKFKFLNRPASKTRLLKNHKVTDALSLSHTSYKIVDGGSHLAPSATSLQLRHPLDTATHRATGRTLNLGSTHLCIFRCATEYRGSCFCIPVKGIITFESRMLLCTYNPTVEAFLPLYMFM